MDDIFRSLFENNRDAQLIHDERGRILRANAAASLLLGKTPGDLSRRNILDLCSSEAVAEYTGSSWNADNKYICRFEAENPNTGEKLPLEMTVESFRHDGDIRYLATLQRDNGNHAADRQLRLRASMLDNLGLAVIGADRDRVIVYCNRASETIFGIEAKDILGRDIFEVRPTLPFASRAMDIMSKLIAGKTWTGEVDLFRGDGSPFSALLTVAPVLDDNGAHLGAIGITTDITTRSLMEQQLRESEEKYRHLFDMESDAIFLIDNEDGRIYEVNRAAESLYGFSREELLGMHNYNLSAEPDETREATARRLSAIPVRYHRRRDGTVFPVEIMASHLSWAGRPVHIAAIRDITERMRSHDELMRQRSFLRAIIDHNPNFIYVLDREGRSVLANRTLAAAVNMDPEVMLGKTTLECGLDPEIARAIYSDDMAVLRGERERIEQEEPMNDYTGAIRWLYTVKQPLRDENGVIEGLMGVSVDITERKRSEEVLRENELKLRTLFEETPSPVLMTDEEGRYIGGNRAALEFLECSLEELLAKTILDFIPPADKDNQLSRHTPFLSRRTVETDYLVGGQIKTLLLNVMPLSLSDRTVMYGIGQDITERKRTNEALRRSEEKFSKAFMASPSIITISELKTGRYIEVNESFSKIIGFTREEVLGSPVFELDIWADPEDRRRIVSILLENGTVHNFEVKFHDRDRRELLGLLSMEVIEFNGSRCLLTVVNDVTFQRKTEMELREKSDILTNTLRAAPVGVTLVENRSFIWTNDTFPELLGYTREEMYGQSSAMIYPSPEEYLRVGNELYSVLEKNHSGQTEVTLRRKDGSTMEGLMNSSAFDPADPVRRSIVTLTDITWKKRIEADLLAEKERLAVTLASIGDAVIATDTEGRVSLMNRVAEDLTGWRMVEAMGLPLTDIFHIINEQSRETCENPVFRVLESGSVVGLANHTVLVARDGVERPIEDSGAPIRNRDGGIVGVVLVFRDVTGKREMEDDLRKTQKLESLGILAGGIAHDFNNILTGILGNISLAMLYATPETELHEVLQGAENEAFRARDLTQQLLTFSKGGTPVRKVTSIGDLLRQTVQFALRGSNVRCEFSIEETLWPAIVDEGQVSQVINNLIINADQAMPRGGVIRVAAENVQLDGCSGVPLPEGMFIRITIADQGTGIPRDHLPRIFDPYFTTKERGHGLGLATTYSIVRKHDGHIEVESEPGSGSTFRVYFPAMERRKVRRKPERSVLPTGRGKILLMDDEKVILDSTGRVLQRLGYDVETALDGAEAIERYRTASDSGEPFDLVIMDLTIPGGMGGLEAMEQLREYDPEVRAMVSSGYSSDHIMADFNRFGFAGVIAKPYRMEELGAAVKNVLRCREESDPPRE